jgi:hypothetical protein
MATFTVRQNRRYKAKIRLGVDQKHLPNEIIANKIRGFGFACVKVVGSGRNRVAEAAWLQDEATMTVTVIPGRIDWGKSQFPLATLLEAIGNAEDLQPPKEIPSKRSTKGNTKARRS